LGNREGQNATLEIRYADGRLERLPRLAAELVRFKVDVILAASDPSIAAAQKATTSIPKAAPPALVAGQPEDI
jgi:hypothetical protein